MDQAEFAEFLEANISDMSVPLEVETAQYEDLFKTSFAVPTDLIALARGLTIHVGAKVKNAFRTQSGETEMVFEEAHTGANGEPLHVPGLFLIRLPLFVGGTPVGIAARLRYRLANNAIVWSYELYRWQEAIRGRVGHRHQRRQGAAGGRGGNAGGTGHFQYLGSRQNMFNARRASSVMRPGCQGGSQMTSTSQ